MALAVLTISGCATPKVRVTPEARTVSQISAVGVRQLNCQHIHTYTLKDAHPNNVAPVLMNETHFAGGNRYAIAEVLDTRRGRPTSVVAEFYSCSEEKPQEYNVKPAGIVKLLPGAHSVEPISFAEIENTDCKVLTSYVVEPTHPESIYNELSNEVFMRGGNRYHITKIIATDGTNPTPVAADIYRCKHRSVDF